MMGNFTDTVVVPVLYLISAVLFIYGLKGLTRVRTAQRGNAIAALHNISIKIPESPFNRTIISYERMLVHALLNIADCFPERRWR